MLRTDEQREIRRIKAKADRRELVEALGRTLQERPPAWTEAESARFKELVDAGKKPTEIHLEFPTRSIFAIGSRVKLVRQANGTAIKRPLPLVRNRHDAAALAERDERLAAEDAVLAHLDPNVALMGDPTPTRRKAMAHNRPARPVNGEPKPFSISAVRANAYAHSSDFAFGVRVAGPRIPAQPQPEERA